MSHIGKRVRLINGYLGREGQVGTITAEHKDGFGKDCYFTVQLDNGAQVTPYAPGHALPQCEWVDETPEITKPPVGFTISGSKNLRTAMIADLKESGFHFGGNMGEVIHCNYNEPKSLSQWKNLFQSAYVHEPNITRQFSLPAQYQGALDYAKAGIDYWTEQEAFKPGDYVYISGGGSQYTTHHELVKQYPGQYRSGGGLSNNRVAEFVTFTSVSNCPRVMIVKDLSGQYYGFGYEGDYIKNFRKATPEEIAAYQKPQFKTLSLGTNNIKVNVFKQEALILGNPVAIARIETLVEQLTANKGETYANYELSYDEQVPYIRFGCTSTNARFSIADLRQIITAADQL